MIGMNTYRILVGRSDVESEAERQRLAADLEERILTSGLDITSVRRESDQPGETMAAGSILSIEVAGQIGRKLLEAVRSWLASRRTEIELHTPDGRKIRVSAANIDEALQMVDQLRRD
jgi:hypothetical protein